MTLDPEQRRVAAGMAMAVVVTALVLGLAPRLYPLPLLALDGVAARLGFALQADLFVLVWLVAAVGNVARGRFLSRADIAGSAFGPPSRRIAIGVAIVQNTLEQAVLAVGAHLALASLLPPRQMALIPCLVALFALGRVCFWLGYRGGAGGRAFGFAVTFYPTVFAYGLALWQVIGG
jgi:hypothetical protein